MYKLCSFRWWLKSVIYRPSLFQIFYTLFTFYFAIPFFLVHYDLWCYNWQINSMVSLMLGIYPVSSYLAFYPSKFGHILTTRLGPNTKNGFFYWLLREWTCSPSVVGYYRAIMIVMSLRLMSLSRWYWHFIVRYWDCPFW